MYVIYDKRKVILLHEKRKYFFFGSEPEAFQCKDYFNRELARKETQLHMQINQTRDELRKCQDTLRSIMNKVHYLFLKKTQKDLLSLGCSIWF